jgi:NhaP-type Na+/H+ or K+/H+ antiporter
MSEPLLLGLAAIVILGVLAQWLAWRFHLPAILLLLIFGILAGPVTGVLDPDAIFGELLFPLVTISVAIILFEGGLSLRLDDLRTVGWVIRNLVTVGVGVTWVLAAAAAHFVTGIAIPQAILLGAILVVSGPTVIIPLLRNIKPIGRIGAITRWEGIINDPIGAVLAVLVFEALLTRGTEGWSMALRGIFNAALFGGLIGLAGAAIIVVLLRRYLIPDYLHNAAALMIVVAAYVSSSAIQPESGLIAVTFMGIILANQKYVSVRNITEFKESLRVLLISSLFLILTARLSFQQLSLLNVPDWVFVALLIVIVRPAAVSLSTLGSGIKKAERLFLIWMAPRGIVAAAVVSVFVLRLGEAGFSGTERLLSLTFQTIMGTVFFYGLTAPFVARRLRLASSDPQGVLIAGAQKWAREIAAVLKEEGFQVALVDSNHDNISAARSDGFKAYYDNVLSEELLSRIELDGIGRLLAMIPNDEVNSLAALHFLDVFSSSEVYQLPPSTASKVESKAPPPRHLHGRHLFDKKSTYDYLEVRFRSGAVVKRNSMTEEFDFERFRAKYGESALPLFIVTESKQLKIWTADDPPEPETGEKLISIVDETD